MTPAKSNSWFTRFAKATAHATGQPSAFAIAVFVVAAWAISGPLFGWSDSWQLVINTSTTIVTFLMVFLIQNTQNRDAKAMHLKLDELLRAVQGARTGMVNLEHLADDELEKLQKQFERIQQARGSQLHGEAQDLLDDAEELITDVHERAQAAS